MNVTGCRLSIDDRESIPSVCECFTVRYATRYLLCKMVGTLDCLLILGSQSLLAVAIVAEPYKILRISLKLATIREVVQIWKCVFLANLAEVPSHLMMSDFAHEVLRYECVGIGLPQTLTFHRQGGKSRRCNLNLLSGRRKVKLAVRCHCPTMPPSVYHWRRASAWTGFSVQFVSATPPRVVLTLVSGA